MTINTIIVVIDRAMLATVSIAGEHIVAREVDCRTAPIALPSIEIVAARREIQFPNFDVRLPREKPRRDWEQRQSAKRRRRR